LGAAFFPAAAGPEAWAPPTALAYPELAGGPALHPALMQHPLTQLPVRVSLTFMTRIAHHTVLLVVQ